MTIFDHVCDTINIKMRMHANQLTRERASLEIQKIIQRLPAVTASTASSDRAHRRTILKTWIEINR
jgi:vacuolar-type H+-ATPase subunit I/STV1